MGKTKQAHPLALFDVYMVRHAGGGRQIPGTSRRADSVSYVAVERGPFDARVEPPDSTYIDSFPAFSKDDALTQARDRRSPRAGGRRR